MYWAWARAMVSTRLRVSSSRPAQSSRAARMKYDWKVVSKKSVRPHSVPPVSRLDAAKCRIVARVRFRRVPSSTPAASAS